MGTVSLINKDRILDIFHADVLKGYVGDRAKTGGVLPRLYAHSVHGVSDEAVPDH